MDKMRFLIAAGGSQHSHRAVHAGIALATAVDAEVVILWVASQTHARTAESVWHAAGIVYTDVTIPLRAKIRSGPVAQEILAELSTAHYDLLILGERRPHRLLTRVLGSVVDKVSGHAPCAVLVVRGAVTRFTRLLICDSGGLAPSVVDVWLARGLARLAMPNASITVLHVMSQISAGPGVDNADLVAEVSDIIARGAREGKILAHDLHSLNGYAFDVRPRLRHGFVVDEIAAEARESQADLVVIGAHHSQGLQGRLMADLAKQIASRVAQPVLIVR